MNVELVEPFQWPEAPTDLQPWSNELFKQRAERLKENRREQFLAQTAKLEMQSSKPVSKERKELAELAQKMLSGEVKWKNDVILDPKWDEIVKTFETKEAVDTAAVKAKEVDRSPTPSS
jgi:large subunit ribosomal protein L23